ncbi:MAG: Gfo/Idh/MocA family oxidoreductase [Victivallales bacterium]|nr:Gfo/Idh/MocA family oxidoreductase [Victivallales bacterium]
MGIKLGMLGLGQFGSNFVKLFKAHPLVDKIALCDCEPTKLKTFTEDPFMQDKLSISECCTSLDELVKKDLDAIAIITQPWLHAPQCLQVLNSGKHVYSAVPLIQLPDDNEVLDWCHKLAEAVKRTGCQYMLGETTIYRPQTMFCRRKALAGEFGEFVYAEGEYVHDVDGNANGWANLRNVMKNRTTGTIGEQYNAIMEPYFSKGIKHSPMSYPTHSVSGPIHVMQTRAIKVSAYGVRNTNNDPFFDRYDMSNIFALYQLANGTSLRIAECREIGATSFDRQESEIFRIFGKQGSFSRNVWQNNCRTVAGTAQPIMENVPNPSDKAWPWAGYKEMTPAEMRTPLPPEVQAAFKPVCNPNATAKDDFQPTDHGGSHPYLVHEFVCSVAEQREPAIPIREAAHYMAMGIAAHKSALRDGEITKVELFD